VSAPALVVLIEPSFGSSDRAWIEALRKAHDPHQAIIGPHLTLIFPGQKFSPAKATDHVERIAKTASPFDIAFAGIEVETVTESDETYVYLMPGHGSDDIAALRLRLCTGPLAGGRDKARPYRPHLTLGRFRGAEDARALARRLSAEKRRISALATEITSANFDGAMLRNVARHAFGAAVPGR